MTSSSAHLRVCLLISDMTDIVPGAGRPALDRAASDTASGVRMAHSSASSASDQSLGSVIAPSLWPATGRRPSDCAED